MAASTQLKNQHLLWRAGFGPAVEQLDDLSKYSTKEFYRALVKASAKKPEYINVADNYLQGFYMGVQELGRQARELTPEQRRDINRRNRDGVRSLNLYWIKEMVNSGAQLREKMAFFWHGHFACRNLNVFYQQQLLQVIRTHALGDFGTLLREVSHSAAMLNFLNNQQNRKDRPNENFAREVMELFTMGRGNYSENDIKDAARAFTGWTADRRGDFVFRKNFHDTGKKTVLGVTGNLNGDDVLDILLEQEQTAKYICTKLFRFMVSEDVDQQKVDWLASRFYKNKYDIAKLMEDMFSSDWFYDEKYIGAKIKSPVELLAGIQRMIPMALQNDDALLTLQRILGQTLFYPPNVAGWAGGRTWIDSSTLMMRLRVPQLFNDEDELNVTPKDDDDQMMGRMDDGTPTTPEKKQVKKQVNRGMKPINANLDWTKYLTFYEKVPREKLINEIAGVLLQTPKSVSAEVINKSSDQSGRENFIRTSTIQIMSTPEYQLC